MHEALIRRRLRTIVGVEDVRLSGTVQRHDPFTIEVAGSTVRDLPVPPARKAKYWKGDVEAPRPARILTDNQGCRHYFWQRSDAAEPSVWYFTIRPSGIAVAGEGAIELSWFHPGGTIWGDRITWKDAQTIEVGAQFGWEYPFQEVMRPIEGKPYLVLGCGGSSSFGLPMTYIPPTERLRNPWPSHVRTLLRVYNSDAKWRGLINALSGKYHHQLFADSRPLLPAIRHFVSHGRPAPETRKASRKKNAYCFDGQLPLEDAASQSGEPDLTVTPAVAWGERGDLAWFYRYGGKIVAVVVDCPQTDRAAWVFADEGRAAELLSPLPLGMNARDRHLQLKERAVYYCVHQGAWRERIVLTVLARLRDAGHGPSANAYTRESLKDTEAARQVAAALSAYRERSGC